jgi:branched-subunit amino acid transport protein AzlD
MPSTGYLVAALGIAFAITFTLRAAPFAVLGQLRRSQAVRALSLWMPVGILAILTAVSLRGTIAADPGAAWKALTAVAVTAGVHLAFGRRTILSVGLGTLCYVVLLNVVH